MYAKYAPTPQVDFQRKQKFTYPLIPSRVLLAKSTRPPAGRARTPTTPLPRPLKNPDVPACLAPAGKNNGLIILIQ